MKTYNEEQLKALKALFGSLYIVSKDPIEIYEELCINATNPPLDVEYDLGNNNQLVVIYRANTYTAMALLDNNMLIIN